MSAHAAPSGAENGRQPASVTLTMVVEGSTVPQTHTASSRGEPPQTFLPKLRAGSFRLDQSAMDRLASSDDRARAAYFLSRFFPSDHEAITALDDARSSAETAWRNLPEDLAIQLSGREDGPAGLPPVCGLLTLPGVACRPGFRMQDGNGRGRALPAGRVGRFAGASPNRTFPCRAGQAAGSRRSFRRCFGGSVAGARSSLAPLGGVEPTPEFRRGSKSTLPARL